MSCSDVNIGHLHLDEILIGTIIIRKHKGCFKICIMPFYLKTNFSKIGENEKKKHHLEYNILDLLSRVVSIIESLLSRLRKMFH